MTAKVSPATPQPLRALTPGQGVGHGVQVGGHAEAVDLLVVAHVDHHGEGRRGQRRRPGRAPGGRRPPRRRAGSPGQKIAVLPLRLHNGGADDRPDRSRTPSTMLGAVAAVVVAESAERLAACLSAVGRQVYGPTQLFVVGGDQRVRAVAGEHEALWRPSLRAVLSALAPETAFTSGCCATAPGPGPMPWRPWCATVPGPRRRWRGPRCSTPPTPRCWSRWATPPTSSTPPTAACRPGELDQQQYDVIRDVAAVSGASMLVRLDLLSRPGGPRLLDGAHVGGGGLLPAGPAARGAGGGGALVRGPATRAGRRRPAGGSAPARSGRCRRSTAR